MNTIKCDKTGAHFIIGGLKVASLGAIEISPNGHERRRLTLIDGRSYYVPGSKAQSKRASRAILAEVHGLGRWA